ncbi:MAG: A/G-specific adenine glycosylase [Bacteroidetes bacterium]|nr:A/G-specific adenine glycosylase [Bacteroidota bacterium]MBS1648350.1 A/G-specific adenine glycosylase [Bacteroidota bacterium]
MNNKFTAKLMLWHETQNKRVMPWKEEKDPYKIWLSEIILQQTRVEQGWNYYEKFIEKYPTVFYLANAKDEDVFKLWEGLGYYNRCKNLLFTARLIVKNYNGKFPETYNEIVALKGVGPYTAAAIASFAYNLPYAVIDGNVFRVLARYFEIDIAIDTTPGKKKFIALANEVLDKQNAGKYNQAIMDFGATVCKPIKPLCSHCVLQKNCLAYNSGCVNKLPIKQKIITKKHRYLYYFLFECKNTILVQKRMGKDIWQYLYEIYLLECAEQQQWNKETIHQWLKEQLSINKAVIEQISPIITQQLTHQQIKAQIIKISIQKIPVVLQKYQWKKVVELKQLAFPKILNDYFQDNLF